MNEQESEKTLPFAEGYWKEEGGEKWAEHIDATEASLQAFSKILLDGAEIMQGETILDIGCGGGTNSIEAALRTGAEGSVTGIDISPAILAVANERGADIDNLGFVLGDAANTDLGEEVFDLIFSRFGVMFFSDPVAAFTNLGKSLKKDGKLVFMCWRSMEENPWMSAPATAVFEVVPPKGPPPQPGQPGPFSMAMKDSVVSILGDAGMTDISIETSDAGMELGSLEDAVAYFMKMGPAAATLIDATDEQKSRAAAAIREALSHYETERGITAPAAVWLVKAFRGK